VHPLQARKTLDRTRDVVSLLIGSMTAFLARLISFQVGVSDVQERMAVRRHVLVGSPPDHVPNDVIGLDRSTALDYHAALKLRGESLLWSRLPVGAP
jgi:hypothetical protein